MILRFNFSEWMKMYRPAGYGTITVGYRDPKTVKDHNTKTIRVQEVVCDLCNDEIKPKDDQGQESDIFQEMDHQHAMCHKCGHEPWVAEGHGRK